jgi:hypothetical protein
MILVRVRRYVSVQRLRDGFGGYTDFYAMHVCHFFCGGNKIDGA